MTDSNNSSQSGLEPTDCGNALFVTVMCQADVESVSQLERRCNTLPWTPGAYSTEVRNPSACYLVAKKNDGAIVGYAGMWIIMDEAHVTTIGVDPILRGRKVGEVLLNALMQCAVDQGAARATLEVRQGNIVAHRLYVKYGYQDVAMRKNYYSDNSENAIIMWADDLRTEAYLSLLAKNRERLGEFVDVNYDFSRN